MKQCANNSSWYSNKNIKMLPFVFSGPTITISWVPVSKLADLFPSIKNFSESLWETLNAAAVGSSLSIVKTVVRGEEPHPARGGPASEQNTTDLEVTQPR